MTEPEQWRFQWPDGTWIRWNPQTQAWEKETAGADVPAATDTPAPGETAVVEDVRVQEPSVQEPSVEEPLAEEPQQPLPSRRELRTGRTGRSMVGDVLPPHPEPERPGGSLWPTVVTGMVVGLGVGLLIWNVIR